MIFTAENILMIGSILIFSSILISKTGYRFGIPTLLLFLIVGMCFGSDGLGLQFNSASDAQFIGMMALSIILFSGGMDTKYNEIKPHPYSRYCPVNRRCIAYNLADRYIYILYFRLEPNQHRINPA